MRVNRPQMTLFKAGRRVLLTACVAALSLPAAAMAGETSVEVSSSGLDLDITATSNETNSVTVTIDDPNAPTAYLVTDGGAGVNTTDPLCSELVVGTVSCPIGTINRADITLSNRNDTASIATVVPPTTRARMNGGTGNDALFGTPANDELSGSSDVDSIFGRAGNDTIDGDNGNDNLFGEEGADEINGDRNNDYIDGGPGGDAMRGGSNNDTVSYITRTAGVPAQIGGQAGNADDAVPGVIDTINADVENLLGGSGPDVLIGDRDGNLLIGGAGNDFLLGLQGSDRLLGGNEDDFISGDSGNDVLKGGFGADAMFGGIDSDRLRARDGARDIRLRCGPGRDRLKRDRGLDPRGKSCKQRKRRR